ncbi:MAG: hypothetical protein J7J91_09720 [Deltaproteobacteria bacterium]|nr:hypothetical protein [Deltaproteobacteria bacterium]
MTPKDLFYIMYGLFVIGLVEFILLLLILSRTPAWKWLLVSFGRGRLVFIYDRGGSFRIERGHETLEGDAIVIKKKKHLLYYIKSKHSRLDFPFAKGYIVLANRAITIPVEVLEKVNLVRKHFRNFTEAEAAILVKKCLETGEKIEDIMKLYPYEEDVEKVVEEKKHRLVSEDIGEAFEYLENWIPDSTTPIIVERIAQEKVIAAEERAKARLGGGFSLDPRTALAICMIILVLAVAYVYVTGQSPRIPTPVPVKAPAHTPPPTVAPPTTLANTTTTTLPSGMSVS